jgi:hypothetical protein
MRLKQKVVTVISKDTDGKEVFYSNDNSTAEGQTDAYPTAVTHEQKILAAATEALKWGDLVVKGITLQANNECQVALNGSADLIQLRPLSSSLPARLFLNGDLTGIEVTAGAADVLVTYVLWGDHA